MLESIAIVLIILWLVAWFTSHSLGGLVHVLLAVAIVLALVRLLRSGSIKNQP